MAIDRVRCELTSGDSASGCKAAPKCRVADEGLQVKTNRNLVATRRIRIAATTFASVRSGGASETLERRAPGNSKSDGPI